MDERTIPLTTIAFRKKRREEKRQERIEFWTLFISLLLMAGMCWAMSWMLWAA